MSLCRAVGRAASAVLLLLLAVFLVPARVTADTADDCQLPSRTYLPVGNTTLAFFPGRAGGTVAVYLGGGRITNWGPVGNGVDTLPGSAHYRLFCDLAGAGVGVAVAEFPWKQGDFSDGFAGVLSAYAPSEIALIGYSAGATEVGVELITHPGMYARAVMFDAFIRSTVLGFDLSAFAGSVDTPTLLVWGNSDNIAELGNATQWMQTVRTNSTKLMVFDYGHDWEASGDEEPLIRHAVTDFAAGYSPAYAAGYAPPFEVSFRVLNSAPPCLAGNEAYCYAVPVAQFGAAYWGHRNLTYSVVFNDTPPLFDRVERSCYGDPLDPQGTADFLRVATSINWTVGQVNARVVSVVDGAFAAWAEAFALGGRPGYFAFTRVNGTADVSVYVYRRVCSTGGYSMVYADVNGTIGSAMIAVNANEGNAWQLQMVAAHEMGRVLGLGHGTMGFTPPVGDVMTTGGFPADPSTLLPQNVSITTLDLLGVTYYYDVLRASADPAGPVWIDVKPADYRGVVTVLDAGNCTGSLDWATQSYCYPS